MKILNFFFFPFKLIFYILHILYLDFRVSFKIGLFPILEHIGLYQECWKETKNIDFWYKDVKDFFIELLTNKKDNEFFRINCIFPTDRKRFLWWYIK